VALATLLAAVMLLGIGGLNASDIQAVAAAVASGLPSEFRSSSISLPDRLARLWS